MVTMVVEDGTVVANANSYVSVATADAYFEIDVNFAEAWDAYDTPTKEARIMWASRTIDQKVTWKGYKTDDDSAMRWPRSGVYDRDGEAIGENEIPNQLIECVCELLKYMVETDVTTSQGADYLKSVEVDVIKIEYQPGTAQLSVPPILNQILRGIGYFPSPMGSSFGRIIKV